MNDDRLHIIDAKLDRILALLEKPECKKPALRSSDRESLAALLPAVYESTRFKQAGAPAHATHNWTTKELLKHARAFPALLESIEKVFGSIDEGTACRLGQLLRHGVGGDIEGLTVVHVEGSKGRGVLWAVRPFDVDKPSKR